MTIGKLAVLFLLLVAVILVTAGTAVYFGWSYLPLRLTFIVLIIAIAAEITIRSFSKKEPYWVKMSGARSMEPGQDHYQEVTIYCLARTELEAMEVAKQVARKQKITTYPDCEVMGVTWWRYYFRPTLQVQILS